MLWSSLIRPILFRQDAESVHEFSMTWFGRMMAIPGATALNRALSAVNDERLQCERFGIRYPNPVGLAAGFDKNARWVRPLASLGFGAIEVGTLTPVEQAGNAKPRIFRLPEDSALINRLGFNNGGASKAASLLRTTVANNAGSDPSNVKRGQGPFGSVLGVNIGKNKVTPNEQATDDYRAALLPLWSFADYITVNVSSPNTVGLRALQDPESLDELLYVVSEENDKLASTHGSPARPVLLKIAPDLDKAALPGIVEVARRHGLKAIIATNTTIDRSGLRTAAHSVEQIGAGGLSGAPLTQRSREVVSELYQLAAGELRIVGVGGIMNGEDAWRMITAGASLVQVYTGFIYGGPGFVNSILKHLLRRLQDHGLQNIDDAVGLDHRR